MVAPTEREVVFAGTGAVRLAGTLTLPTKPDAAPVPGLVLLAGSGPTDRNGNQTGLRTDVLKQIAAHLAQEGIASLRYDKRGIGANAPLTDPAKLSDFVAWENYVGDTVAGLRYLQQQPEIDPARTGLLGHSEGGLIALQAAHTLQVMPALVTTNPPSVTQAPQVLVLVSTPGRPLDKVVHEQLAGLLKRQQATPEQMRFFLDKNDAIAEALRKTGVVPNDVPPGLAALYPPYLGRFYHSVLQVNPPLLAAQFSGPVLIIQGAKDIQVQATKDAVALDTALKGRPHDDHELYLVPAASHNLKLVEHETDPGFEGPVVPAALDKLCAWLQVELVNAKKE